MARIYKQCDKGGCNNPANTQWRLGEKCFCSAECKKRAIEESVSVSRIRHRVYPEKGPSDFNLPNLKKMFEVKRSPYKKDLGDNRLPLYPFRIGDRIYYAKTGGDIICYSEGDISEEIKKWEDFFISLDFDKNIFPEYVLELLFGVAGYARKGLCPSFDNKNWSYKAAVVTNQAKVEIDVNRDYFGPEYKVIFGQADVKVAEGKFIVSANSPAVVMLTVNHDYTVWYDEYGMAKASREDGGREEVEYSFIYCQPVIFIGGDE